MTNKLYGLILAGGRGERLRPLTNDRPKPMVEIMGIPIIEYQVSWMKSQGITDVVFLCGYLGEKIFAHFGDGSDFEITAHYSYEDNPLGRGGAVKKGFSMIPNEITTVLVTNGDVLSNQNLDTLLDFHVTRSSTATVMTVLHPNRYGLVESDSSGNIIKFSEKGNLPIYINSGIYFFERSICNLLPDIGDHETTTFPKLVKSRKISSFSSNAFWTSIETQKDLIEIAAKIKTGKVSLKPLKRK
jgi:NDP-sugar pyrophosphorylase family protein|tara:strand:+ start:844 stop:1572 length:729 start_codon:yes stop_codon:yes gene_type:complete